MTPESFLPTLCAILAQPTAPFCEEAVRAEILRQLAQLPSVKTVVDPFGNVIATYQRANHRPRWLLNAHMDHPGYVGGEFLGGVPPEYLESGAARRDFGRFAMWDLPACEISQGRIHSRACDNLISCASILAVFQELEHEQAETAVMAAFTCAEEVGLLGAVYLARGGAVPPDVRVLSLETSAERPPAQMGHGVVVRVGDRTSIFDPRLTSELASCAAESGVQYQRCLMSGGTCEATAYQLYGYRVAGLCVPLGNYHNCAPNHQIGAEYVDMGDVLSMVHLCNAIVRHKPRQRPWKKLKAALELRLNEALTHRF